MRFLCFLFLVVFAGAVAAFAWFNTEIVSVRFFDWSVTTQLAAVAGVAYGLGMLSGWSVVGMVRRSIDRVTDPYRRETIR
jgi:putative membrane protein